MRKIKFILIIILISVIATGCWDMVEINQRLFPYTIGVDLNNKEGEKYIITITYPNINGIGKNPTQKERIHIISTESSSVFEGASQMYTRLQYPFYFKHLRVLVLGHEVARDEESVRQILDGLNRDFIINKKLRITTSEGKAMDLLLSIPSANRQEVIEGTLFSMLKDRKYTSRYSPQTLTGFIKDMDMINVTTMPRSAAHGDDIKVFGACLYKNYKFICHLGEIDNRSMEILKGKVKSDIIDSDFKGENISFSINGVKAKKSLVNQSENLKVRIDIEIEGVLQEYILMKNDSTDGREMLKEMEKAIGNTLQKEIENTLKILQKENKADAIGIGEYISKFHPKVWEQVSEDWDEVFSEMEIEVNINPKIRRKGLVK